MSYLSVPRVYFADIEAYNNGCIRGVWVNFVEGIEPDEVQFAIDALLKNSHGEEWRIDDQEGFAEFKSCDLEKLCQVAAMIHEHGENAVKGWLSQRGDDAVLEEFADEYLGCFKSEADFCEQHLGNEIGITAAAEAVQVFDWGTLAQYIDWQSIAVDAFIQLYFSHQTGYETVHVYTR